MLLIIVLKPGSQYDAGANVSVYKNSFVAERGCSSELLGRNASNVRMELKYS